MKKKLTILLLALMCLTSAAAIPAALGSANAGTIKPPAPSAILDQPADAVVVTGNGKIVTRPDSAELSFGIESCSGTFAEALKMNSEAYRNIEQALKAYGISGDGILTDYCNSYTRRCPDTEKETVCANRNVRFRTNDLSLIESITDAITDAGANRIHEVRYILTNTTEVYRKALEAAKADALSKVSALQSSGLRLTGLCEMGIYWYNAPNQAGCITVEANVQASFSAQ